MATLFKRKLRNGQKTPYWMGKVRQADGWHTVTLFTDKAASQAELNRLQAIAERKAAGLVTTETDAASTPLADHIAEYLADCERQGYAAKHLYMMRMMLNRLAAAGGWQLLAHINADAVRKLLKRLADGGMTPATSNKYLIRLKAFCGWCVKHERLAANPLASVSKARENPARRSAFTDEQAAALLAYTPEPRRAVYRTALLTGLRRGELRQLQWGDLHLDAATPFIQLRATTTKNRRDDVLPLHTELVAMFRSMMPGHPQAKVFARIPGMKQFRTDLRAAGIHDDGLCFHSLRHTFCTRLVKSGCGLKEAQQLMRHSTVELTAKVYTHLGITDTAGALQRMAEPQALPGMMTGTDDTPVLKAHQGAHQPAHQSTRFYMHFDAPRCAAAMAESDDADIAKTTMDSVETAMDRGENNKAGDGIRTHDVQLGKLAFYH